MKNLLYYKLLFCLCLIFISCKPQDTFKTCKENCVEIKVKGQVKNMETNVGMKNIPISIHSEKTGGIFYVSFSDIGTVKTDKQGNFTLNLLFDSTMLRDHYFELTSLMDSLGSYGYYASEYDMYYKTFNISEIGAHEFLFEAYPKTSLTLHINKWENADIDAIKVLHTFESYTYNHKPDYEWNEQQAVPKETLVKVFTGAGKETTIYIGKHLKSTNDWSYTTASIKCGRGKDNVFEITF